MWQIMLYGARQEAISSKKKTSLDNMLLVQCYNTRFVNIAFKLDNLHILIETIQIQN